MRPRHQWRARLRARGPGAPTTRRRRRPPTRRSHPGRAKSLKQKPVLIKGFATHNNTKGWIEGDHMLSTGAVESGERAFKMAGLGPKDIDTAQIYDCFTYMVLTQLEDYGFCKKGEGG